MRWVAVLVLLLFLAACTAVKAVDEKKVENEVKKMKLTSSAFSEGDMIPSKFTCQGEDINPSLIIEDVPAEAKSLALIVDDPDAPGGVWVHWLVKDIPVVSEIKENSVPGAQVSNDFGKEAYGGPCPPSGVHRYFFRLYALDVESLDASSKEEFYSKLEEHAIAKVELMGRYEKG